MDTLFTKIKDKIDKGQPDDAILIANQLIKEGNEDAYLYYLKGRAYMKKSDWKKAIEALLNSNRISPGGPASETLKMLNDILDFYNKDMYNP